MIPTLVITIITEGFVALGYSIWRKKPVFSIMLTSIGANVLTQVLLWGTLILFFQNYPAILFVAEILIWIMESLALHYVRANQLQWVEAITLSLSMNLVSFALGWFLPV